MDVFEGKRVQKLKQMVGTHYSDTGAPRAVVVNLLALAVNIYVRALVSRRPRFMATTKRQALMPTAAAFEQALNEQIAEMDFESSLRDAVLNAMFGAGYMKIALDADASVSVGGESIAYGQPYCEPISPSRFVYDTDVEGRNWLDCAFLGYGYRLPLDLLTESGLYRNYDRLVPVTDPMTGDEKAALEISRGQVDKGDQYFRFVEVEEYYLPHANLMVTLPRNDSLAPIREVEWTGPKGGPFKMLGFGEVPDQIQPLPPTALWMDMHLGVNEIFRKLLRQAQRQKSGIAYESTGAKDAERLTNMSDGETIRVDGKVTEISVGGPNPENFAFGTNLRDVFSWMAGNLDTLGGLSPQADTLGQEQILRDQSSAVLQDMRDRVAAFARSCGRDIGWYLWDDPLIDRQMQRELPGLNTSVETSFSAETREGAFSDYAIALHAYSMQESTPAGKLQALTGMLQQFVFPAMPLMQAQGIEIDMEALLRMAAKLANLDELNMVLRYQAPQLEPAGGGGDEAGGKPAFTQRETIRTNRPGATRHAKDAQLTQSLLGVKSQQSESGATFRGVS